MYSSLLGPKYSVMQPMYLPLGPLEKTKKGRNILSRRRFYDLHVAAVEFLLEFNLLFEASRFCVVAIRQRTSIRKEVICPLYPHYRLQTLALQRGAQTAAEDQNQEDSKHCADWYVTELLFGFFATKRRRKNSPKVRQTLVFRGCSFDSSWA